MPTNPAAFLNRPGAPGTDDLVTTVLGSAEVLSGKSTYDQSFDAGHTAVRALELAIAETDTRGSAFQPLEPVQYVDATQRREVTPQLTAEGTVNLDLDIR